MKQVELKKYKFKHAIGGGTERTYEGDYGTLIETAVNNTGREGIDTKEMKIRIDILDIIEKVRKAKGKEPKIALFEDAVFEVLKRLVNVLRFQIIRKEFLNFVEYVNNKEKTKVNDA